ncbi:hypothetical protein [Pseudomonas pseudonitroreducens]|uniref:hypothetical protein n=1 Tax=Pseudomonas pseudonitroreducens TaxID=2892326 RepID=UPI001F3B9913|nr:hypothetical protein [Pseudomonas pseudonitroreducens]
MSIQQGRIDVHHPIIPPVCAEAIYRHGLQRHAGAPWPSITARIAPVAQAASRSSARPAAASEYAFLFLSAA